MATTESVATPNGIGVKKPRMSKNEWRRAKAKKEKVETAVQEQPPVIESTINKPGAPSTLPNGDSHNRAEKQVSDVPVEDDPLASFDSVPGVPEDDPLYQQFRSVMARFNRPDEDDTALIEQSKKGEIYREEDNDGIQDEDEEQETTRRLSKKRRKEEARLSVAELKAVAKKPELVEWTDPYSIDAPLLLDIKSSRNVIPVPSHWSLKREYLSTKRGIEKPAFQLPKFIADTGIGEMRNAALEKQNEQTLKQKQRERVAPKMGKLDIDYAKLYDAFFRFQTKPELTRYGEVYYEGKEFETNLRHLKPGELSDELREALHMSPGQAPPWLIQQQRFGPPPSYPALKIPGVNAPPPAGSSWGFAPGQYGRPPVDEQNRPLFGGDLYGISQAAPPAVEGEPIDRDHWGMLAEREEEEEEDEDEDDEAGDEDLDDDDMSRGRQTSGFETSQTGTTTTPYPGSRSVVDNLRKHREGTETEEYRPSGRSAGQVIKETSAQTSGFFGSDRSYDLKGSRQGMPVLGQDESGSRKRKAGDVDVSVDIDELQRDGRLNRDNLSQQYEAGRRAEQPQGWNVDQEDLSDMIAEESRKRQKKEEARRKGR